MRLAARTIILLIAAVMIVAAVAAPLPAAGRSDVDAATSYTVQYRTTGGTVTYGVTGSLTEADALHSVLIAEIQRNDSDLFKLHRDGELLWTRIRFNY